jgi:hypothetical protein
VDNCHRRNHPHPVLTALDVDLNVGAPFYITPEFAGAEDLICGCRILCVFLFSKGCGF